MPTIPLALLAWLLTGAALGLLAARLLPGRPALGSMSAALVGAIGALFGGLLATLLGFGGLIGVDGRALAVATAAGLLTLVWLRVAGLAKR
ncbi:MAG: hypothetical protein AAGN46_11410 [Acidobacteriota bacterium]